VTDRTRPHWLPTPDSHEASFVAELLRREAVGGTLALLAAAVAVVWANVAGESYQHLREIQIGHLTLEAWAGDGVLAVFFFMAGLELKRELLVGSLRRPADAAVPVAAALAGVGMPAVIYVLVNRGTDNLVGWAIPSATDIAFALAVLAVVGSSLPAQLRAFLLTLAVVDDLVVILVIAVFYTDHLSFGWLAAAVVALAAYAVLQRRRVTSPLLYVPLALGAWWCVHESGVHATIAGVALGLLTRVIPDPDEEQSPAERLEHRLSPLSSGVCVPVFAFFSAGVVLSAGALGSRVAIGVALGLVVGKPIGVFGGAWLVARFTRAELNEGIGWRDIAGVAVLAGVGFTVSLLVSDLSFDDVRRGEAKTAVLAASVVSALLAALLLGRRNRVHREG
jgi:NhaA family Na+:H+ antiporter